jgi:hypothetical protein
VRRVRLAGTLLLLGTLLLTTGQLDLAPAGDAPRYREIAAAAPGAPEQMGSAYTGRVVPHYAIGLAASATGVSLDTAYVVALLLVVIALVLVVHRLLRPLPPAAHLLAAGLVLLHPIQLRSYLAQPATLQDLVFVLGLAMALVAIAEDAPGWAVAGAAVALCGRQSALLVGPVLAIWCLVRARPGMAGAVAAITAGGFVAIDLAVASFTEHFEPRIPQDTVLAAPLDAELAAHVARTLTPLIAVGALLACLLWRSRGRAPARAGWALALGAVVVAQPLAIDPAFPGFAHNEQRLAALGVLPLAYAVGVLTGPFAPGTRRMVAGGGLLVLGSLHHVHAVPAPPGVTAFLVLQALVAAGLCACVLSPAAGSPYRPRPRRRPSGPSAASPRSPSSSTASG